MAALKEVQDVRQKQIRERLELAAYVYSDAVYDKTNDKFDLGQFGFEFSLEQIEMCAMDLCPNLFEQYERELAEKRIRLRGKAA